MLLFVFQSLICTVGHSLGVYFRPSNMHGRQQFPIFKDSPPVCCMTDVKVLHPFFDRHAHGSFEHQVTHCVSEELFFNGLLVQLMELNLTRLLQKVNHRFGRLLPAGLQDNESEPTPLIGGNAIESGNCSIGAAIITPTEIVVGLVRFYIFPSDALESQIRGLNSAPHYRIPM